MRGSARIAAVAAVTAFACLLIATAASAQTAGPKRMLVIDPKAQTVRLDFKSKQMPDQKELQIAINPVVNGPSPKLVGKVVGDLVSKEGHKIKASNVTLTLNPNGQNAFGIAVRVDPTGAKPGRYTGTVQFGGTGYTNVLPVTVIATLRGKASGAFLLLLLGLVLGLALKCLVDTRRAGALEPRAHGSAGFVFVALLGLLGGVIAWAVAYYSNDTWGATGGDKIKLFLLVLIAVVAAATLAELIPAARFRVKRD